MTAHETGVERRERRDQSGGWRILSCICCAAVLLVHSPPLQAQETGNEPTPPAGRILTEPSQRPAGASCWLYTPPGGGDFPYPFLLPELLFACNPFLPEARNPVDWGFPADYYVECATWENGGLTWLYYEKDEGPPNERLAYWGAWVKQPCYRFCGIPQPYPEKAAGVSLPLASTPTSAAPWDQYPPAESAEATTIP